MQDRDYRRHGIVSRAQYGSADVENSRLRTPSTALTLAVAMATFNGERFLSEQLDSLARQTRLPHELVVCDDCSTDGTVELITQFARDAPFPVRLVQGGAHRGYANAFLEAARLTRSDLVAFCDQDDIWVPEKLAQCAAEFERRPDISLVVHSALVASEPAGRRSRCFPSYRRRRELSPASAPILTRVPGFAIVASRRHGDPWNIVEPPEGSLFTWQHDDWTTSVASALGWVVLLPDRLVLYRQHSGNTWGVPASSLGERLRSTLAYQGEEEEWYRETATWARDHVRLLEELGRRMAHVSNEHVRRGPRARAALWARVADTNDRRAELYLRGAGLSSLCLVGVHAGGADYGRRDRGGLGFSSLVRDVLYATGLLGAVARVLRAIRRGRTTP